ncbi:MAG: hypothetical protein LLG06_07935 [Desulfobacteraceae bacterium]|nr:hypothetical protein [Desulfobacteraceae bacterium]
MESPFIICPKCGFEQPGGTECARCGVIFAKVRETVHASPDEDGPTQSIWSQDAGTRRKFWTLVALLLLLAAVLGHGLLTREIRYPPGILISSEPQQRIIKNPVAWRKEDRLVIPLARFSLQARVLSRETYRSEPIGDLSPIDLALGWGPMSDQAVLDRLEIAQGNRCFYVMPQGPPPLPMEVLLANSSNMHMLPSNAEVSKSLDSLRVGELVEMRGFLVGIQENGQWTWVSSLKRNDTGNGACEIFWVEHVSKLTKG